MLTDIRVLRIRSEGSNCIREGEERDYISILFVLWDFNQLIQSESPWSRSLASPLTIASDSRILWEPWPWCDEDFCIRNNGIRL